MLTFLSILDVRLITFKIKLMKLKITFLLCFILALLCFNIGQSQDLNAHINGGEYKFNENKIPCLTEVKRTEAKATIANNIKWLRRQNRLAFDEANRGSHPLFIWPIQKAAGVTYNDVWGISNYVDQNSAYPNQVLDFNCGSRTYDTSDGYNHAGMDIFNWPFSWKMMDNDEVEIIAAAPGQIIYKAGSNFDRSCALSGGNWNAVYVQHADGSVALYGHMKQNSPTTKNVGDMVAQGEYLGIVGSSGNSTGPHLHFEVYSAINPDVLIDPYAGACNSLNVDSWWQSQKPYNNPNINALLTHSAAPVFPTCPTQEIPNESNDFDASDTIYFGLYMRDQAAGTSVNLKIIRPDNSILYNWDYNFTDNYVASYWYWYYTGVYNMDGQWKWEATYLGQTVSHTFNVTGSLSIDEENFNTTFIFPNPVKDVLSISSNIVIQKATVTDVLGKIINTIYNSSEGIKTINVEALSNGMYFLILEGNSNQKKTIRFIKE